jgi:hypothetical protein
MFLKPEFTYDDFQKRFGVSRATALRWRKRYFPEITTKEALFNKLMNKNALTSNELALLLNISIFSVNRLKRHYEGCKMQQNAPQKNVTVQHGDEKKRM